MDITLSYKVERCISCNFQFAVPKSFDLARQEDHKNMYCPSCRKGMCYSSDNEVEKLKKKNKLLKSNLEFEQNCCIKAHEQANHFEKKAYGYKGYATKLKNQLRAS